MQLAACTTRPAAATNPRRSVRAAAVNKQNAAAAAAGLAAGAALLAVAAPAIAGEIMTFDAPSAASGVPSVQGIDVAALKAAAAAAAAAPKAAAAVAAKSSGVLDGLSTDNPGVLAGLAAAGLGLPAGLVALLKGGKAAPGAKATPASAAIEALENDARTTLVDIRSREAVKQYGSPALPKGRRAVALPFTKTVKGEYVVDEDFADRFESARLGEDAPVILLDSFGKEAPAAAKALASAGVVGGRKLFYVADGAEGPRGWKASGEGWREPSKGLNFGGLKNVGASLEALASDLQAAPTTAKAGLAAGALVAAGVLLFNEVEAVLELAGALAAGQFIAKRLVFAADRKKTAEELDALVREVAPSDLGSDLAKVGSKLLEDPGPRSAASASASSSAPGGSGSLGSRAPPASTPAPAAAAASTPAASTEKTAAAAAGGASEAREWIAAWRESNK